MKIRVLFLYGGDSVEHEISIISALQAMDGLDTERYEAIPAMSASRGTCMAESICGSWRITVIWTLCCSG